MPSSAQLQYQIEQMEKFLSGKMSDEDADNYKQELAVKYMTPEEKKEWADGAEERNKEIDEQKKQKQVASKAAAKTAQQPQQRTQVQSVNE